MTKRIVLLIFSIILFSCAIKTTPLLTGISNTKDVRDSVNSETNNENEALTAYLKYLKEEWKDVKNPLIVSYVGCSIGDYFHFKFQDSLDRIYDFANGGNNLNGISFFDTDYNENPNYVNQTFKIDWAWNLSKFPCCDGEYDIVNAKVPSIVMVEIIE